MMVWRNPDYDAHIKADRATLWMLHRHGFDKSLARHFIERYRPPPPKTRYAPLWWSLYVVASLVFGSVYLVWAVLSITWLYGRPLLNRGTFRAFEMIVCSISAVEALVAILVEAPQ